MATAAGRFGLYPATIGTLELTDVRMVGLKPQSKVHRAPVSGAVDAGANLLASAEPQVSFETRSLAALFGTVNPVTGFKITTLTLRLQQRDADEGFFMSTNVHQSEAFGGGFVALDNISAQSDDEAPIVAKLTAYAHSSDGLANPLTRSAAATISGTVPAFGTAFYMGPVYYNASEIPGIRSWSFEPGLKYVQPIVSGAVIPTMGYVVERRPVLRFNCLKTTADAAASVFLRTLAGALTFYGRKAVDAGIRVADISAVHLKISASAGAWFVENIEATELDDAMVSFVCFPTTVPTTSVASAIP